MVQATPINFSTLAFGCPPPEGAVDVTVDLDFGTAAQVDLDVSVIQSKGKFSQLQTIYIDNSLNAAALVFTMNQTYQKLTCPANKQGYFAVLQPSPPTGIKFTTTPGVVIKIQLLNFFLPTFVW